jgi:hypothetical protein
MDIYIHINTRFDSIREKIIKHERVFIAENCVPIYWGDDGIFLAMVNMFRAVLSSGKCYGHVLICSGQDLLVRKGIDEFLTDNSERVYLYAYESDRLRRNFILHKYPRIFKQLLDKRWDPRKILRSSYMRLIGKFPSLFLRNIRYDVSQIKFYYSTFWGALPLVVVKDIIDRFDNDEDLLYLYKGSFIPEESFLATFVMSSKYKDWLEFNEKGVSSSLTYILRVENGHPPVITMNDVKRVEDSKAFFARKFDLRVDSDVINLFINKTHN